MSSEREIGSESRPGDRRDVPRRLAVSKKAIVSFGSGEPQEGTVVDESLGGIGLEFDGGLSIEPALNEELQIVHDGIQLTATLRHLRRMPSGACRIGVQWNAAGFSQMQREPTDDRASEFFQTLPSGLFLMSEFMEHGKWVELGEAAERLQRLASRCGISELGPPVQQVISAIDRADEQASLRRLFHKLIERCVRLGEQHSSKKHLKVNRANAEAVPSGDVELVDSLLRSIEKTSNEITIESLAEVLRGLMASLSSEVMETVFGQIVDARDSMPSEFAVHALGDVLKAAAARLLPGSVEPAFHRVSGLLDETEDAKSIKILAGVLKTLAEKLPNDAAERIFEQVISKICQAGDEETVALGSVAETVADRLPAEAVQRVVPGLIHVIESTGSQAALRCLRQTLQLLTDRLPIDVIPVTFHQLVVAVDSTSEDATLECLAQVLNLVTERMPVGESLFG